MTIRLLLADDHAIVREGVSDLLSAQTDIEVVGGAETALQVVALSVQLSPDIVVMDISLPGLSGIEATRQVVEAAPSTRVLILSMHSSAEHVYQAFGAGAMGYVLKEAAGTELVTAVRTVHAGRTYLSTRLPHEVMDRYFLDRATSSPLQSLSMRERQVLELVVEGYSSTEIGASLSLSPKSVNTYRSRIMRKLSIGDLPGLVKFAIRHGLTSY
ncbi:MAG: response regulator transcription factor [Betaproteobacteria bacterium]|nr:response regulator transcription factor [Betaproteobacteria bacterium]